MTTEYNIYKAQGTGRESPTESAVVKFNVPIPDFDNLFDGSAMYQHDAQKLCGILRETLPGGTFDRLLVEMLKEKASLFRVPYSEKE